MVDCDRGFVYIRSTKLNIHTMIRKSNEDYCPTGPIYNHPKFYDYDFLFPGEEWRHINESPVHMVSNMGRIKVLERRVRALIQGKEMTIRRRSKILRQQFPKNRYPMVELNYKGLAKSYTCHRLIAKAFCPNPDKKPHS